MLIRRDLKCVACGYNLRNLTDEGNCPECGTPIVRTLFEGKAKLKHTWLWIGLTIFALFHLVMVSVPVIMTGGSGEGQAFAVAILDCPLAILLRWIPGGSKILYGGAHEAYVPIFSVGGLIMYALFGALLGDFIDRWRWSESLRKH